MHSSCVADRLGAFFDLTTAEREALRRLEERERPVRRGGILVRENDAATDLFILKRGMLMSHVILADGSRQILRFLMPGDLVGFSALAFARAPETITAQTDAGVTVVDRPALLRLIGDHPRLGGALAALGQLEMVMLTDRLAAIGRTSAKARVAAVLLEVRDRLRQMEPATGASFALGLTQEAIGDATGLTAVHVNRMLRQLEEEGLIARDNGRVTLLEEARLARAANYVDRASALDLGWLSTPR